MTISDTLAKSLHAFQSKAPSIQKDGVNPHFKNRYVTLEALIEAVLPTLNQCGLVLSQSPAFGPNGEPALTTRITHMPTGETLESTMPLLVGKSDPQGLGSAITYARRYSLMAMLGLVADEDDDGNRASRVAPAGEARQVSSPSLPADATGTTVGATDPQRKKLTFLRDSLLEKGAISAETAARVTAALADAELTKERAGQIIDALVKIENESAA
jgi:hypothetical protein